MNSTASPPTIEANAGLAARADETLAHAYEQIARADEQLARVTEQLSKMERDAARPSPDPGRWSRRERPAFRGLVGLLLAACIIVAAFLLQSPYGDTVRLMMGVHKAPQPVSTSGVLPERPRFAGQPDPSTVQLAAADGAVAQGMTAPTEAPPRAVASGAPSPELLQLLQNVETMAHDLANLEQRIEQLKAKQEQMAADDANALDQLRIRQEEMTGLIGKVFDRTLELTSAAPSQPTPALSKSAQARPSRIAVPSRQGRALPRTQGPLQREQ